MTDFRKNRKEKHSADKLSLSQPSVPEEIIFRSFFENRKNYTGFYIDIGTHHPYPFFSISQFNQKGWKQIMLEPASDSARLFDLFYKNGVTPGADLNSSAKDIAERKSTTTRTIVKIVNLRKVPLSKILDDNLPAGKNIDFLSLDAEDFDPEVLKLNNRNNHTPLFVIIKFAFGTKTASIKPIYLYLKERNYEIAAKTERALFYRLKNG
ncbi:MAG: FkbM family methyltransferase [Mucilaginibacter sp.]|nr:FkbM family methyltransferase [Mucilaginibacter sp.]